MTTYLLKASWKMITTSLTIRTSPIHHLFKTHLPRISVLSNFFPRNVAIKIIKGPHIFTSVPPGIQKAKRHAARFCLPCLQSPSSLWSRAGCVCVRLCQRNVTKRLLCFLGEHLRIRTPKHPESQAACRTILFAMPPIAVVVVVVCGLCVYACVNAMLQSISRGFSVS